MSASLETSSKSAPKAEDVELVNRQTARDIPASMARTEAVIHFWWPPLRSAEASKQLEISSEFATP
eukprot:7406366-Pyramimonas_sp.AAC.1